MYGVSAQREAELVNEQRTVARMWITYQQLNQSGLETAQRSVRERYEQLTLARGYQPKVIPGMLQTEAYTREALRGVQAEQGVSGVTDLDADLTAAVAERMDRQTLLNRLDAQWMFILEEWVLWLQPWSVELQIDQLHHLLQVRERPTVSIGVIPTSTPRQGVHPSEGFSIADAQTAAVELESGYLSVTEPAEIEMYLSKWEQLSTLAVFGEPSVALIKRAIATLEELRTGQDGV